MSLRLAGRALALAALAAAASAVEAAAPGEVVSTDDPAPTAAGRLLWVSDDDLDLIGDVRVELPWRVGHAGELLLAVRAVTTIERAPSDLAFDVRELDYTVETGWRMPVGSVRVSALAGQLGRERVDADGQPWLRWVGGGVESARFASFPAAGPGLVWRAQAGAVVDEREVGGDGVVRGTLRWTPSRSRGPWTVGLDLDVDALLDGGRWRADVEGGARVSLPFGRGRRAALLVHWLDGEHPLGPRVEGVLIGVEVAEGAGAAGRLPPPDVWGEVALGGGDGRAAGRLRLALESPTIAGPWRAGFEVDANVLTARETGDLFYRYHAGLQRDLGRRSRVGAWFHHRSNHVLAEPNDRVTSLNVLEGGIETRGYDGPPGERCSARGGPAAVPCLDARLRVGWLVDSSFGEDRGWHVRAGARARMAIAWLGVEAEAGDVERWSAALGAAVGAGWEALLERRYDEQSFAADRRAWLLAARYGF